MKILKAALLGMSLDHSISPQVHQALFQLVLEKSKCDYTALDYSMIECKDERSFFSVIKNGVKKGYAGFNITFPFKYAASKIDGEQSEIVNKIYSANSILCSSTMKIISTDGDGFRYSFEKMFPNLLYSNYSLIILGAGGAARALLHTIHRFGWRNITVVARSISEARKVVEQYDNISVVGFDEISRDVGKQFVVHATPVGQRSTASLIKNFEWCDGDIAADLVYNPLQTRFLDRAAKAGANIVDGLGMLIEQAALSQYFWMTGNEAEYSLLGEDDFNRVHALLSKLLTQQWDAFAT